MSELDLKEEKKEGKDKDHKHDKHDKDHKDGASSPVDPEMRLEEYKQNIRKAETGKMKAEARIEALRAGGSEYFSTLTCLND